MKRFHVHVSVKDLSESILFYSKLFACDPTVRKTDYAKWMLDDPRINFAISQRGHATGVNHLGFQTDSGEELRGMRDQLRTADANFVEQTAEPCCYARSDKYWVTDPAGIAWETFHTLGAIPVFGEDTPANPESSPCCIPPKAASPAAEASCCVPTATNSSKARSNGGCAS